jgi:hypothetical protein
MKQACIAAKERWARKRVRPRKLTVGFVDRLPPGQREVHNFPALNLGVQPQVPPEKWGLWKLRGYSELADPWTADRFSSASSSAI